MIPWSTNDGFLYRNRKKYLYKGIEKKNHSHIDKTTKGDWYLPLKYMDENRHILLFSAIPISLYLIVKMF